VIGVKKKGGAICILVILLLVGLTITPAIGGMLEADAKGKTKNLSDNDGDTIVVYFWDCTGKKPVKKVLTLTETEWNNLRDQLRTIRTTSDSIEESFDAQFTLFKQYSIISYDITYETLKSKAMDEFKDKNPRLRTPIIENAVFNVMCAISFELTSGTSLVFGLNTFINIVGFDIISFHKGYSPDGIQTKGLAEKSNEPGEYIGSMFGLLGYWFGTKTGTGTYSDVIVSGFTVTTGWLPTPLVP
jgi:hypothetical protein